MNEKNKPSLEDLGLDAPISTPPSKISIEKLQRESEFDRQDESRKLAQLPQKTGENLLGVVGFTLSLVSLLTIGCLSPVSGLISFIALKKEPRSLALAGLIISILEMAVLAFFVAIWMLGHFVSL